MDKITPDNELMLMDKTEGEEDTPQETKDNIIKNNFVEDSHEEIEVIKPSKNKELKEYKTNTLLLNSYWIELVSKGALGYSLIIYECIGFVVILSFLGIIDGNFNNIKDLFTLIFSKIGLKWLFFVNISQHLSKGFFCLTNCSKILKEKNNPLKFFISYFIKSILYYLLSIIIMMIIEYGAFGSIEEKFEEQEMTPLANKKVKEVINKIKILVIRYVGNLLADYNNSLDKLLIGSLYIILFSSPKCVKKKYLIFFRLLSILPISYILISFIFRTLNNLDIITLNLFVSPIFAGNKFIIFGFFITFILYVKYKEERKYKIFDEEDNIIPDVFAKISSKIFAFFGFVEFFIGFIYPSFSIYGIGNNYLIILCAPIMILYDYKRDYELRIKPCKNINLGTSVNILTSILLYGLVLLLGFILFISIMTTFDNYFKRLCELIDENFELIMKMFDLIYNIYKSNEEQKTQ